MPGQNPVVGFVIAIIAGKTACGENSFAPISGVSESLNTPSISYLIFLKGRASLFTSKAFAWRSVLELYKGSAEVSCAAKPSALQVLIE